MHVRLIKSIHQSCGNETIDEGLLERRTAVYMMRRSHDSHRGRQVWTRTFVTRASSGRLAYNRSGRPARNGKVRSLITGGYSWAHVFKMSILTIGSIPNYLALAAPAKKHAPWATMTLDDH